MDTTPFQTYLIEKYVPVASYLSASLAALVIIFMIGMSIYDRKLVDRVSLRLQTALAAYDFWLHTGSLWKTPYAKGPGALCVFFGWNMVSFTLFYFFINVSIAVNLQLVFIHNKPITKMIEAAYWIVPAILSLIITIPPLALGRFGWYSYGGCYMTAPDGDEYQMKMLDFFGVQLWRSLSLIYLMVVVILVTFSLRKEANLVKNKYLSGTKTSAKAINSIRLLAYRILLYPIAVLVAYSAGIISQIYYDFVDGASPGLDALSFITYPLGGTLNFVAFCCDPTVHSAIKKTYLRLYYNYHYGRQIRKVNRYDNQAFEIVSEASSNGCDILENGDENRDVSTSSTENEDVLVERFVSTL